jgi:precorrin-6B methylase 2
VFSALGDQPLSAEQTAQKLGADVRGTTILLDALAALGLLDKRDGRYATSAGVGPLLSWDAPTSVLAMVQHQANCLRRWAQLARAVKSGTCAEREPSIRGAEADEAAFIGAMDNVSAPVAAGLVAEIGPLEFRHLLDVGGASGTWTIAFLRSHPQATATLFDLPHVIPLARKRLAESGLADCVRLVAGDFYVDPLPTGADLAWVSAITHQNSREQNRRLFSAVWAALAPGGQILIRDILMDESRTSPPSGALFAVNMLVGTEAGGTYTFGELRADLEAAGFTDAAILRRDEGMHSVLRAAKPG